MMWYNLFKAIFKQIKVALPESCGLYYGEVPASAGMTKLGGVLWEIPAFAGIGAVSLSSFCLCSNTLLLMVFVTPTYNTLWYLLESIYTKYSFIPKINALELQGIKE